MAVLVCLHQFNMKFQKKIISIIHTQDNILSFTLPINENDIYEAEILKCRLIYKSLPTLLPWKLSNKFGVEYFVCPAFLALNNGVLNSHRHRHQHHHHFSRVGQLKYIDSCWFDLRCFSDQFELWSMLTVSDLFDSVFSIRIQSVTLININEKSLVLVMEL